MDNDKNVKHIKNGYEIPMSIIYGWLKLLHEKTNNRDIEHALRTVKFINSSKEEKEIYVTIKNIYLAEMNGDLNPSPSMRDIYTNIDDYICN